MRISILLSVIISFYYLVSSCYAFNMGSNSSVIEVAGGASLKLNKSVNNFNGKIIKNSNSTISGESISFDNGILNDAGTEVDVSGEWDHFYERITLSGNQNYRAIKGKMLASLRVSGKNNKIEGEPFFENDVELMDSNTTLSFAAKVALSVNVKLNNGALYLDENLSFVDGKKIIGPGKVGLNGRKLSFGAREITWAYPIYFDDAADIELGANTHLTSIWTFSGSSILNGNNNILYLDTGGKIILERGSKILIKNITLRKITTDNIFCMDNSGTFTFQDVRWVQDDAYTFSLGSFEVISDFKVQGENKFTYKTTKESNINTKAKMTMEKNTTFSYDSQSTSRGLLTFDDSTSILRMEKATLHSTSTGMQLEKGTLEISGKCYLSSEASCQAEGIMFGDGSSSDNNLTIEVNPESGLKLNSGYLVYQDVD
jgi:hypothetical protein